MKESESKDAIEIRESETEDSEKSEQVKSAGDDRRKITDTTDNELDHMLPEDLAGKIIGLPSWTPVWRASYQLEDGKTFDIDLNAFSGDVTCKLPSKLPIEVYSDILASLKVGTIVLAEEEVVDKAAFHKHVQYSLLNDQQTIDARIFVSETSLEKFKEAVGNVKNTEFLVRCIDVESMEKNRKEFIDVLRNRVKEVG